MDKKQELPLQEKIDEFAVEVNRVLNKAALQKLPSWAVEGILRDHLAVSQARREIQARSTLEQQPALIRLRDAGIEP